MHGPSFCGDAVAALLALADHLQGRLEEELAEIA
jgi:hypothetical protein